MSTDPALAPDPWERRTGESDERFRAFSAYRDMWPRSLRRIAAELGYADASLVARWSSADNWQDRVAAWDLEQDRQRRAALERGNIAAGERHASIAAAGLQAAAKVNLAWLTRLDTEQASLDALPFTELSDLMVRVNRVLPRLVVAERLARGMSTEHREHSGSVDVHREQVERWTDSELDAFLLGAQAGAVGAADPDLDPDDPDHQQEEQPA